ncbi:TPA: hypothetical protein ACWV6G_005588, partial [Salmonella enterica subsp. enterica serovar Muenchen]
KTKAHSLVGFCVLVKDHFCQNNAVFVITQLFFLMRVKCINSVQPDDVESPTKFVPDHRRSPTETKGDKIDIFSDVSRYGGSDGVSGDFFITQPMSWGLSDLRPRQTTESEQCVCKSCFFMSLAAIDAVATLKVSKRKCWRAVINEPGFILLGDPDCF